MSWRGGDENQGDTVKYDIYFEEGGVSPIIPDAKISDHQSGTSWTPPNNLNCSTYYYWKIVAWDSQGLTVSGPVWHFKTTHQNFLPTAIISGSYIEYVNEAIQFDGTQSVDNDENGLSIVRYDWSFFTDDSWHSNIRSNPMYTYNATGQYIVTLRV